jgi:bacteriorhodopsin
MAILLEIHSILRWVIVIVGLIAIVKFLIGWISKSEFGRMDRGLSSGFSGLIDLQVMLGLVYFLVAGLGGAGISSFSIEHTVTMLIAAFVAHAPTIFKKRPLNKFAISFFAVLGALLLIYIGVARLPGGWNR